MKKRIFAFFRRGRWLQLAAQFITQPQKLRELLATVSQYAGRKGLEKAGNNITLLWHYVTDVVTHRYTGYNKHALLLVIAGLIYLVTPVDFFPDFIAGGLIDDVSIIMYIVQSVSEELRRYKSNRPDKQLQE